ncbi:unnamed protein product [Agarophyton chilense]
MFPSLLRRLRSIISPATAATGRSLQLQLDSKRLCGVLPDKNLKDAPPEAQAQALNAHLTRQVYQTLHATHGALIDASSKPICELVQSRLGYVPVIARSSIADAGNGLFISGTAPAGCMVALFPGLFYKPSELPEHISDLAISRYDGVIVDSSHDVCINVTLADDEKELYHPFGTAHYANHGPPNTLQFLLDIQANSLPSHVRGLIPVQEAVTSSIPLFSGWADLAARQRVPGVGLYTKEGKNVLRTVALMALRDIDNDEEVLFNYRFNPKVCLPDWYKDPEPDISERRWHTSSGMLF